VLLGNEEDFAAALGYAPDAAARDSVLLDVDSYRSLFSDVLGDFSSLKLVASTLRHAQTATINDWSAVAATGDGLHLGPRFDALEIYDRIGGGDSFASGLIHGLLTGADLPTSLAFGVAHGALAMTTPGDTSMATLADVERLMRGAAPRVVR
jgi:2-dehydro-3-deoxygluconokinase